MRLLTISVVVMLLAGAAAHRTAFSLEKEREVALLWPEEVNGWKWDGVKKQYNKSNLFDFMDGAAELYLAYNFKELTTTRFEKTGRSSLQAEIYSMASPEDAFGIFSFERQDPDAGVGQGSEFGGGLLRFWKGSYFISIFGEGEGRDVDEAVLQLGRQIASSIKETGKKPELLRYLPDPTPSEVRFVRSHILLNQRFFISHRNILQLTSDVKAVIAPYSLEKGRAYLLLVQYPSEARATSAFKTFESAYMPRAPEKGLLMTKDGRWTRAQRYRDFIVIAFTAPSRDDAENLVKATETKLKGE